MKTFRRPFQPSWLWSCENQSSSVEDCIGSPMRAQYTKKVGFKYLTFQVAQSKLDKTEGLLNFGHHELFGNRIIGMYFLSLVFLYVTSFSLIFLTPYRIIVFLL